MRKWFSWKTRSRVGKVLAFALFLNVNIGWVGTLSSAPANRSERIADDGFRAAREDAPDTVDCTSCGVVGCPSSGDLDSIRQKVQ